MTDTAESLRRKRDSARELQSVVRTMKAMAASSVGRYERAAQALGVYSRTVRRGLGVCVRQGCGHEWLAEGGPASADKGPGAAGAVVFGSDQGLVGRFNEIVAEKALALLGPGKGPVWAVGERVSEHLRDAGLHPEDTFPVPGSVAAISPLVGRILERGESRLGPGQAVRLRLFHCRQDSGGLPAAVHRGLIPQGRVWLRELADRPWPTASLPEILGDPDAAFRALIREYLFVSLFRACAQSLASENASRLQAMQRAERNIEDLLTDLSGRFNQVRQSGIDEELFDVVAGFEALSKDKAAP